MEDFGVGGALFILELDDRPERNKFYKLIGKNVIFEHLISDNMYF